MHRLDSNRRALLELSKEITSIDQSISELQQLRVNLLNQHSDAQRELGALQSGPNPPTTSAAKGQRPVPKGDTSIDYNQEFEWTSPMRARMKQIFSIKSFRLCQEGLVSNLPPQYSVSHTTCTNTGYVMPLWMGEILFA